jgi:hypothetical protein
MASGGGITDAAATIAIAIAIDGSGSGSRSPSRPAERLAPDDKGGDGILARASDTNRLGWEKETIRA